MLPQVSVSVRVKDKSAVAGDPEIQKLMAQIGDEIGKNGRILLRKSGTEPVIRVMAEYEGEAKCRHFANRVVKKIEERGWLYE